ncbi:hypothetical protein PCK1_002496 [Pneumocystis canis]|nr:hypothetical protein PCK1_002496 [Pneumocystis canis]
MHTVPACMRYVCLVYAPSTELYAPDSAPRKTTFLQRLNAHLRSQEQIPYIINLDPAVLSVPYSVNDIN